MALLKTESASRVQSEVSKIPVKIAFQPPSREERVCMKTHNFLINVSEIINTVVNKIATRGNDEQTGITILATATREGVSAHRRPARPSSLLSLSLRRL